MIITVVGAGYVGLTAAAVFAKLGHTVWLIRRDQTKIEQLKNGIMPFYEPGMEDIVGETIRDGRLRPTHEYAQAIGESEVVFICVGTPPLPDGGADLSQVEEAGISIAKALKQYTVVVNKSTVPVGTAQRLKEIITKESPKGTEFSVASCPEFLREGSALSDSLNPDRIVIGTGNDRAKEQLLKVHEALPGQRVCCSIETAEMIKYASNAFLATKISFINEIANLCDEVGANVDDVAKGMGLDPRIGKGFLKAGIGYGGSCFPKDTRALYSIALKNHYEFKLLKSVIEVNNDQRKKFFQKIQTTLGTLQGQTIGVLGLAFKNNTDDIRESASVDIIHLLANGGATVRAYDPIIKTGINDCPNTTVVQTVEEVFDGADAVCLLTEWEEFLKLDWKTLQKRLKTPIVFDGRNLLNPEHMREWGYKYFSVGRPHNN